MDLFGFFPLEEAPVFDVFSRDEIWIERNVRTFYKNVYHINMLVQIQRVKTKSYILWVYKTNLNVLSAWKDGGAVGDGGGVWHTGCTCKYSVFITTSLPYEDELSTTLMAMSSLNASSFLFHNDWRLLCTAARYWKLIIIMMTLSFQYNMAWSYISLVADKFAYRLLLH